MTWEEFCKSIKMEFGPSQFTDYMIDLKLLKQYVGVQDYNSQFQKLSKKVQGIPEPCLVSQYIGGLKEEIRFELQLANPKSLLTAMQLSKLHEAKFQAIKRTYKGSSYFSKNNCCRACNNKPTRLFCHSGAREESYYKFFRSKYHRPRKINNITNRNSKEEESWVVFLMWRQVVQGP